VSDFNDDVYEDIFSTSVGSNIIFVYEYINVRKRWRISSKFPLERAKNKNVIAKNAFDKLIWNGTVHRRLKDKTKSAGQDQMPIFKTVCTICHSLIFSTKGNELQML